MTLEFPHVGREHPPAYFTSSSLGGSECEIGILHRTSAARPISDMSSKTCSFSEADVGKSIDIRKDFKDTSFTVKDEYDLSLCEENKKADQSLGKFYNAIFSSEMITLIYRDGDECGSRKYDSVININCVNSTENELNQASDEKDRLVRAITDLNEESQRHTEKIQKESAKASKAEKLARDKEEEYAKDAKLTTRTNELNEIMANRKERSDKVSFLCVRNFL